jgi:hypothetical protein
MQLADVVFVALVIWLAIELWNGGDGGRRSRLPVGLHS